MPSRPNSHDSESKPQALSPPQFGLRTLLALTTVCAALLALLQWLPPAAVALLAFFAVTAFCHVAGNALGTRLRQIGDCRDPAAGPRAIVPPQRQHFAPTTHLSRRQGLGWLIVIATSVGITSGAVGGGLWTFVAARGRAGLFDIAVGTIAFAVLGGLAAFAVCSFTQVLSKAIWQALTHNSPPPPASPRPLSPSSPPAPPCAEPFLP